MKINSKDILNKKIIAEKQGKEIATAQDLFFDTKNKKVVAILTNTSKGLNNAKGITLKKIKSISETIIIENQKDLLPATQIIKPEKDKKGNFEVLAGSKQVTEDGQDLGTILAVVFDSKSGKILEIISKDNDKEKTAKIERIITVSPGMTVVKGREKDDKQQDPIEKIRTIFQ
jgi:uncharacterized protein YrrD